MKKHEAFPDDWRFLYNELKTPEARQVADQIQEIRDRGLPRKEWENLTEYFFDILADYFGQYDARCIFNKLAKPVTKREAQLEKSARLLFRYIEMTPKRNVAKLVRQLANEDGSDKDAITQSLWRAVNTKTAYGKKVRAYLREKLHDRHYCPDTGRQRELDRRLGNRFSKQHSGIPGRRAFQVGDGTS